MASESATNWRVDGFDDTNCKDDNHHHQIPTSRLITLSKLWMSPCLSWKNITRSRGGDTIHIDVLRAHKSEIQLRTAEQYSRVNCISVQPVEVYYVSNPTVCCGLSSSSNSVQRSKCASHCGLDSGFCPASFNSRQDVYSQKVGCCVWIIKHLHQSFAHLHMAWYSHRQLWSFNWDTPQSQQQRTFFIVTLMQHCV